MATPDMSTAKETQAAVANFKKKEAIEAAKATRDLYGDKALTKEQKDLLSAATLEYFGATEEGPSIEELEAELAALDAEEDKSIAELEAEIAAMDAKEVPLEEYAEELQAALPDALDKVKQAEKKQAQEAPFDPAAESKTRQRAAVEEGNKVLFKKKGDITDALKKSKSEIVYSTGIGPILEKLERTTTAVIEANRKVVKIDRRTEEAKAELTEAKLMLKEQSAISTTVLWPTMDSKDPVTGKSNKKWAETQLAAALATDPAMKAQAGQVAKAESAVLNAELDRNEAKSDLVGYQYIYRTVESQVKAKIAEMSFLAGTK